MASGEPPDSLGSKEATEALTRVFPLAWMRWISFVVFILSVFLLLVGIFAPTLFANRIAREFLCLLLAVTLSISFFCFFPIRAQGRLTWKEWLMSGVALGGPILYFFLLFPYLTGKVVDPEQRVYVAVNFVDTQNNQAFQVKPGAVVFNAQPGSAEKVVDDNGDLVGFVALLPGGDPIDMTVEMPSHDVEKTHYQISFATTGKLVILATPKPLR